MDTAAWIAAIAGGISIAGATITATVKNARKIETSVYAAVREVRDLQVLSRADLNALAKHVRSLEQQIRGGADKPAAQPTKKPVAKKTTATKAPAKRQPRKTTK